MSEKVFLVESDANFGNQLLPKLEAVPYEVSIYFKGSEAVERLKEETPDCIVVDMTLPESEGDLVINEVTQEEKPRSVPVIALVSHEQFEGLVASKGLSDYYLKPVLDVTEVVGRVKWNLMKAKEKKALIQELSAGPKEVKRKRILLVDDNEDVVETLRIRLESEGYMVQVAMNGEDAINEVNRQIPDLILLDVMMPRVDGFSTLKQINTITGRRKVPVLVITGTSVVPEEEFRVEGAYAFMRKPIDGNALVKQIRSALS